MERKERQQAAIIEGQAKRLEELDKVYRDEVVARKRAHNALEDAKGKILLVPGVANADVRITWEPAWNQSMISEEGKMKLGLI